MGIRFVLCAIFLYLQSGQVASQVDICKLDPCTSIHSEGCQDVNGKAECICQFNCSKASEVVCGSDNVTYDNECELRKSSCNARTSVTIKNQGPCACKAIVDLALIVDSSGSISRSNWRRMKAFLKQVASRFDISQEGTHVAIVSYSTKQSIDLQFNTLQGENLNLVNVSKAIERMRHLRGSTFIDKAMLLASSSVFTTSAGMRGDDIPKVALVITDGKQTTDRGPYTPLAIASRELKKKGVLVYALGISRFISREQLEDIASRLSYVKTAPTFRGLRNVAAEVQASLCRAADPCRNVTCDAPYNLGCKAVDKQPVCQCPEACPRNEDPVCGSDDVTYSNLCEMKKQSCLSKVDIVVKYLGKCDPCLRKDCSSIPYATCQVLGKSAVCSCPSNCSSILDPVCGTNGMTFDNECRLRQFSCQNKTLIEVASKGPCVKKCDTTVDLAIIVDSSGSISRSNWIRMKEFVNEVIEKFDISPEKTLVAGVVYSSTAEVVLKFNTFQGAELNVTRVQEKFNEMRRMRGLTFIDKALLLADREIFTESGGMRKDKAKVALVITDGVQTRNRGPFTPLQEASRGLKEKGVIVYALGVSRFAKAEELIKFASTNDTVVRAPSFKELGDVAQRIREDICEVAEEGLATVAPTTPIPTTTDPFPDCRDNITGCRCFVEAGECVTNPEVPAVCARSCDACAEVRRKRAAVPIEVINAALAEKERIKKERERTCGDFYVGCRCWKEAGLCNSQNEWAQYMRDNCKISCGRCLPAS